MERQHSLVAVWRPSGALKEAREESGIRFPSAPLRGPCGGGLFVGPDAGALFNSYHMQKFIYDLT